MTLRAVLPALGLLGVVATSASAQADAGPGYSWVLPGVEFTACIDFLMTPEMAAKQLDEGFRAAPAGSFTDLSPVLRREVDSDTAYRAWVPAQFCVLEAPTIRTGDREFVAEGKMGRLESVGYWAIAAGRAGGAPASDHWFVAEYWTNDWRVRKQSESAFIPMSTYKRSLVVLPEGARQEYTVKIGKTVLSWTGQMSGRDSTAVSGGRSTVQVFDGKRSIHWTAAITSTPQWSRTLPGLLHVEGKDDLAKALKASPIRMFGPMYWGGEARVEFTRSAPSGAPPSGG